MPEDIIPAQPTPVTTQPAPAVVPPVAPADVKKGHGKNVVIVVIALLVVVLAGLGIFYILNGKLSQKIQTAVVPSKTITIGFSLDSIAIARWIRDRDLMTQKAQSLGATVTTLVANSDDNTQIAQIQNLINQKVNVIIVVAHNATALTGVIDQAHKAGVKVIAYDRMILNSNPDLYVSFDSAKVGELAAQYVMNAVPKTVIVPNVAFVGGSPTDNNATLVRNGAMSVLDPLIKAGKAKLVFDQYTANWDAQTAYVNLKAFLDRGGKVDAVVVSNDGMATGVVKALTEHGLAGKVPVSGQDAELTAVKRLVDGTQTVTLYKPITAEANEAILGAIDMANGKMPKTTGVTNNGTIDVSSYLLNPIPVTKDTIKTTVIKDGFYSTQDVY
ncbi:MAG TPA: substrate-binding domain-containing protein [Patescibacteria group bacterium]|nr:substrate-binding domain-containing protein [Patescibacteria group bacterium]